MAGISSGGHEDHERITEVGGEVVDGLDLDAAGHVGAEDLGQNLDAGLDEALGPARLLGFEGGHFDGQLGGALDVGQVFELPAGKLRAVAEVGVFGEGVVLPAAAIGDGLDAPHAGSAVEVEEVAGAVARAMLEDEVAVEQDGLDLGKHAVVAVEVGPAGLHHADLRLGEVVDDLHEPVGRRDKIGVEDGDELAFGDFEAGVEGSGLEAMTIGAMDVHDGVAESGIARDDGGSDLLGFVGGVVEDLDFQLVARVFHGADGFDEAIDHKLLIEDGQLHGDARQFFEMTGRSAGLCSCGI